MLSFFRSSYRIKRKIVVTSEKNQLDELFSKNFKAAYVTSRRKAEIILDSPDLKENGIPVYHMIRESLGSLTTQLLLLAQFSRQCFHLFNISVPTLMAYLVSMNSTLDFRLQNIIQGSIENGHASFCLDYALMLIHQLTKAEQGSESLTETIHSFTTYRSAQILPFFVCFNIGLGLAFLVLLAELAYFKYGRRCRRMLRQFFP